MHETDMLRLDYYLAFVHIFEEQLSFYFLFVEPLIQWRIKPVVQKCIITKNWNRKKGREDREGGKDHHVLKIVYMKYM